MELPAKKQQGLRYPLSKVKKATGKFSNEYVIGIGGSGRVYRGTINKGSETVAVKRLYPSSIQGWPEYVAEVGTLCKIRHRNVVSLIGYCHEKGEMIIIYEFVPNQTLAHHLRNPSFTWDQRLKALIGAGRGLHHLHTGIRENSVVHRDVKSSNILLDTNFEAKVSDFGLVKLLGLESGERGFSNRVMGTLGYDDPYSDGSFSAATDVYSFGVVILEVICGRKAFDPSLRVEERRLSEWAQMREAREIVAQSVRGEISEACLNEWFEIAKRCLHRDLGQRPTMIEAVAALESVRKANRLPAPAISSSEPTPEEDHNREEFNRLLELQAIEEDDASEHEESAGDIPVIESEEIQSAIEEEEEEEDALEDEESTGDIPVINPYAFSVAELVELTGDWKNWIARGSAGANVYRGRLEKKRRLVAIKRLEFQNLPYREFLAQVSTQSRLKHENVVELLGFCTNGDVKIVVSEYAAGRSLNDLLHGRRDANGNYLPLRMVLSWVQRLEIAFQAAKGLCYVHEEGLIHHNIKSNNVLRFSNGSVKITDLQTSTWCSCKTVDRYMFHDRCYYYHSPGFSTSPPSQACDVYSFGVVLTELLTGLKVSDPGFATGRYNLGRSTARVIRGVNVMPSILDPRLAGSDYPCQAVEEMAAVAASCLQTEADSRPDMVDVVKRLRKALWEAGNYYKNLQRQSRRIIS